MRPYSLMARQDRESPIRCLENLLLKKEWGSYQEQFANFLIISKMKSKTLNIKSIARWLRFTKNAFEIFFQELKSSKSKRTRKKEFISKDAQSFQLYQNMRWLRYWIAEIRPKRYQKPCLTNILIELTRFSCRSASRRFLMTVKRERNLTWLISQGRRNCWRYNRSLFKLKRLRWSI